MAELKSQNYQDNLDVTLEIGGQEWGLVEAMVELSETTTPNFVDFIAVPTPETADALPKDPTLTEKEGGLLGKDFVLKIDNEISSERNAANEETLIFQGKLSNLSTAAEGGFEGLAHNPLQEMFNADDSGSFYNTEIYLPSAISDVPDEDLGYPDNVTVDMAYSVAASLGAKSEVVKASSLLSVIFENAGIESSKYELHMAESGIELGSSGVSAGKDLALYLSDDYVTIKEILERIQVMTNSEWWFDRRGTLHFGAPTEGNPVESHKLTFITDTTAGKTTPSWRSVRVIGDGIVSEDGWRRKALKKEEPLVLEANIDDPEKDSKLAKPTFVYRNMSISTQEQAQEIRRKILSKLKEQQAGGKVTVVGMPEVRPMDAIEMPDNEKQKMGGDRYGVTKVIHKVDSSNGFITDIKVKGLADEQGAVYENELNQLTKLTEGLDFAGSVARQLP